MTDETQYCPDPALEADFQQKFKTRVIEARYLIKRLRTRVLKLEQDIKILRSEAEDSGSITDEHMWDLEYLLELRDDLYRQQYELLSVALGHRHSPEEIQGWFDRAVAMGCHRPPANTSLVADLMYERKVPNAPFRARYEELAPAFAERDSQGHGSGLVRQIADAVTNGDQTYLKRMLGIKTAQNGDGTKPSSLTLFISYDQAVKLAKVLGMTPVEAGI